MSTLLNMHAARMALRSEELSDIQAEVDELKAMIQTQPSAERLPAE